jgi:hypothetical protein
VVTVRLVGWTIYSSEWSQEGKDLVGGYRRIWDKPTPTSHLCVPINKSGESQTKIFVIFVGLFLNLIEKLLNLIEIIIKIPVLRLRLARFTFQGIFGDIPRGGLPPPPKPPANPNR